MARVHYWHYLLNEEGQPIPDAIIGVLEAEKTDIYLWIYQQESAGTAIDRYPGASAVGPQLKTNSDGYFEFWIADKSDISFGYSNIKLKITWSKPGVIDDGFVDNIEIPLYPRMYNDTLETASWGATGGQYYVDVAHGLGNEYPIVMLYNLISTNSEEITASALSENITRIFKNNDDRSSVTVIG